MHGYVVFDNNAYKRLRPERLQRVISAERERNIVPLASVAVLQELLAKARDVDSKQRGRNRASIRKLGQHCHSTRDGKTDINFLSHLDAQVYRLLTGGGHPADAEVFNRLGEIVGVVTESDNNDPLAVISEELDAIEQHVGRVEAEYVALIEGAVRLEIQPNQIKRNLDYAASLAERTQALYGQRFPPEEIVLRIIDMAKLTSIAFALRDMVVAEVRRNRGGHGQHANTVWDEEVVASTSMYTTIAGKSVVLVTEEGRLLAAAGAANAADRVCNIATYEKLLGV